jgi:multicomponent Na+:H+ antiporter subunit D
VAARVERGAIAFQDHRRYETAVLRLSPPASLHRPSPTRVRTTSSSIFYGLAGTVAAAGIALLALFQHRLPRVPVARARSAFGPRLTWMRDLHSGHVGDYVTWLTVGVASLGGILAVALR